jgi:hypothetical protein
MHQDLDKDDYIPEPFQRVSPEEIFVLQKSEEAEKKKQYKRTQSKLRSLGFEGENAGESLI